MVPPDPKHPPGDSGRGSRDGGTRWPRRRTPGGAAKPATRFHSRGRLGTAHARPVGLTAPPAPSLPAWEGKCVRSGRFRLSGLFRRPGAPSGKGMGWCGRSEGVTSGSCARTPVEPRWPRILLESRSGSIPRELLTSTWTRRLVRATHAQFFWVVPQSSCSPQLFRRVLKLSPNQRLENCWNRSS